MCCGVRARSPYCCNDCGSCTYSEMLENSHQCYWLNPDSKEIVSADTPQQAASKFAETLGCIATVVHVSSRFSGTVSESSWFVSRVSEQQPDGTVLVEYRARPANPTDVA